MEYRQCYKSLTGLSRMREESAIFCNIKSTINLRIFTGLLHIYTSRGPYLHVFTSAASRDRPRTSFLTCATSVRDLRDPARTRTDPWVAPRRGEGTSRSSVASRLAAAVQRIRV